MHIFLHYDKRLPEPADVLARYSDL